MEARPSVSRPRTLALCALVSALVLPPAAGAATPQAPVALASGTVEQTVASVTDATRGVVTSVQGTAAPVTQPVTTAVEETTARVTEPVAKTVEDTTTGATRQVQPVADDAGKTVGAVTSGATQQARDTVAAATPSSGAEPAAAPARGHIEGPARSLRRGTAVGFECRARAGALRRSSAPEWRPHRRVRPGGGRRGTGSALRTASGGHRRAGGGPRLGRPDAGGTGRGHRVRLRAVDRPWARRPGSARRRAVPRGSGTPTIFLRSAGRTSAGSLRLRARAPRLAPAGRVRRPAPAGRASSHYQGDEP